MTPPEEPSPITMEQLRRQVAALQATLRQMEDGGVDAVIIGEGGDELYELTSADRPYRVIVESMGEGAVTVTSAGLILYANPQFADFLGVERDPMIGSDLVTYVDEDSRETLAELLLSHERARRAELVVTGAEGRAVPFLVAASDLDLDGTLVRCLVFTDLTVRNAYEGQLAAEAAASERHRVAQEVNDTIVQGLVAAEMALDLGQTERAREHVARTSQRARSWIGELAGGEELRPGMAVRSSPHDAADLTGGAPAT